MNSQQIKLENSFDKAPLLLRVELTSNTYNKRPKFSNDMSKILTLTNPQLIAGSHISDVTSCVESYFQDSGTNEFADITKILAKFAPTVNKNNISIGNVFVRQSSPGSIDTSNKDVAKIASICNYSLEHNQRLDDKELRLVRSDHEWKSAVRENGICLFHKKCCHVEDEIIPFVMMDCGVIYQTVKSSLIAKPKASKKVDINFCFPLFVRVVLKSKCKFVKKKGSPQPVLETEDTFIISTCQTLLLFYWF